jgi:hypothetical protein
MAEAWQKDDEDDSNEQIEITFRFTPGDDEDA